MVFGMPRALFPALSTSVFHGGATTLGYLYAAPGAGALIGAATTGWVTHLRRRGLAVVVAVVVWGAAITVFGFSHVLWVALCLLAVAGWADVISAVLRNTILQTEAPDEFRSRLSSVQLAVVQGGPRLGDLESERWLTGQHRVRHRLGRSRLHRRGDRPPPPSCRASATTAPRPGPGRVGGAGHLSDEELSAARRRARRYPERHRRRAGQLTAAASISTPRVERTVAFHAEASEAGL